MAKRSRLRFYLKLLAALAVVVGAYWSYIALRNYYYEKQLVEVLARLDANEPGWEWADRFNKIPQLKKSENAGEEIKAIMRLLTLDEYRGKLGRNEWSFGFDGFEASPSEEAIREFLRNHPNAVIPKDHRETMAKLVSTGPCPEALQRARKLHQYPAGAFPHTYRPFLGMSLLPDVQSTRNLIRLFAWSASLEMAANRPEQAASEISAMLQVVRVFDNDPFTVCILVRSAIVQMTCHTTHRLLAQTSQTSPETLKRLQEQFLREETLMISLPEVYRWERAINDQDMKLLHSGEYTIAAFLELQGNMFVSGPPITRWAWLDSFLKKAYPTIVLGFWAEPRHFARERADLLRHYDKVITWAGSPEHQLIENFKAMKEQSPGVSPFVFRIHNYGGTMESYAKDSYQGIDRIARAMLSYRAHCRCIATALAAERYRLENGDLPTKWEQLSPKYVPSVLLDPFTGKPLYLKALPDGLVIYSVGYNGIDDGGKIFPTDKQYYNDVGYRLWNPAQRRVDMSKELKAVEEELNPQE